MTVPNDRQPRDGNGRSQRRLAPVDQEPPPGDGTEFAREPPHEDAAERAILGACLTGNLDTITSLRGILAGDDWYQPSHATIWQLVCDLADQGVPPDMIAVAAHARTTVPGWRAPADDLYLARLYERAVTNPGSLAHHARKVAEAAALRLVIETGTRVTQLGYSADPDRVADTLTTVRAQLDVAAAVLDSDDDSRAHRAAVRLRRQAETEAVKLRVNRAARRLVDAEEHEATWREPPSRPTLAEELAIIDPPIAYRVDKVIPTSGNVLLTAGFKAGKTTLVDNLVKAVADGKPFLGRYPIDEPGGRIGVFNYELDEAQYRTWLREQNIDHPDRVSVLHLRGYRLPLIHPHVEDWVVAWLIEHQVQVWVVDPFARAFVGCGDENSNSDVGAFLDTLDVIKSRSGVSELVLPTHTGRAEMEAGQERARGATRLNDWADVQWTLTKDEQDRRFFRAYGRDVDEAEELLAFDPQTRELRIGGWDRRGMKNRDLVNEIVEYVEDHPGLGVNEIVNGLGKQRKAVGEALKRGIGERLIFTQDGPNRKVLHFAQPQMLRGEQS